MLIIVDKKKKQLIELNDDLVQAVEFTRRFSGVRNIRLVPILTPY